MTRLVSRPPARLCGQIAAQSLKARSGGLQTCALHPCAYRVHPCPGISHSVHPYPIRPEHAVAADPGFRKASIAHIHMERVPSLDGMITGSQPQHAGLTGCGQRRAVCGVTPAGYFVDHRYTFGSRTSTLGVGIPAGVCHHLVVDTLVEMWMLAVVP